MNATFDYKEIPGWQEIPRDYPVPDFGMDHDIINSLNDLKITE